MHIVAYFFYRAGLLEALEALEQPATPCIGQFSYPGKDGRPADMQALNDWADRDGFGIMEGVEHCQI